MGITYVALALLVVTILTIRWWSQTRWMRISLAGVLLVVQVIVLGLLFDVHAHKVMSAEIRRQGATQDAPRAVQLVKTAQLPDRASAALLSLSLFLLGIVREKKEQKV